MPITRKLRLLDTHELKGLNCRPFVFFFYANHKRRNFTKNTRYMARRSSSHHFGANFRHELGFRHIIVPSKKLSHLPDQNRSKYVGRLCIEVLKMAIFCHGKHQFQKQAQIFAKYLHRILSKWVSLLSYTNLWVFANILITYRSGRPNWEYTM